MPADAYEIPVLGKQYQGSGIVTDIQETVQTTANNDIWTRKVVTLDTGVIYTLDHYKEQSSSKNSNDAKKNAKTKSKAANVRNEQYNHAADSAVSSDVTKNAPSSPPSPVPLTIMVYSKNDPCLPPTPFPGSSASKEPEPIRGIWTFGDGRSTFDDGKADEDTEEEFWKPQEVLLFPPNNNKYSQIPSLETIPEESSVPSGVWGYADDQEQPNSSFDSEENRKGDVECVADDWWHPKGRALVVPPTVEIPANFVAAGRYIYKPDSTTNSNDWPPPVDHIRKRLHSIGKLRIPKCFEENDGKFPIKVFPKSKLPKVDEHASSSDEPPSPPRPDSDRWSERKVGAPPVDASPPLPRKSRQVSFAGPSSIGQWTYPEGQEVEDDHFMPVDVDLYWGDTLKPPAGSVGVSSDDGSLVSWGVWGTSVGSVDLDDPEWEPEMSMVFPPGIEPDPEIAIQGRWAYRMNQNVKIEWPPTVTKTATVFPSKDAPSIEKGKSQGVWKSNGGRDDANEDEWPPVEVDLLGEFERIEDEQDDEDDGGGPRPNGLWGILHSATPDRNWDWEPKDVVFFPPQQDPGDDVWVQGRWAMKRDVGKLKDSWPPRSASARKNRSVGKLSLLKFSPSATVYPVQSVPPFKQGKTLGVWKFRGGSEPIDASTWKPQQVDLYGPKHKLDDTKPSGLWGVNDNAKTLDDSDSSFQPEDIWFYPPGKTPEKSCSVQGQWAFPKSKLDVRWPPPTQSPTQPVRKSSVGKLKIPGAFEKEASPSAGRKVLNTHQRQQTKSQVPSMFSNA